MIDRNVEEILADVADAVDAELDVERPQYRNRARAANPSQVYSIRMPVERVEEVRSLAEKSGVPPTAMLREWILQRLDFEVKSPGHASARSSRPELFWGHFMADARSGMVASTGITKTFKRERTLVNG